MLLLLRCILSEACIKHLLSPLSATAGNFGGNPCTLKPLHSKRKTDEQTKQVSLTVSQAQRLGLKHVSVWTALASVDFILVEWTSSDLLIHPIVTAALENRVVILAQALISFSLSIERIKSIMLILYLLLACPQSFVISLLLLIWCNVMKCLEAALGVSLAVATGVGATCRPPLKPVRLSKHEERWGGWAGDSREQPQTQRQWDRCRSGGRDHPLRSQHLPNPQSYYPRRPFLHMHV